MSSHLKDILNFFPQTIDQVEVIYNNIIESTKSKLDVLLNQTEQSYQDTIVNYDYMCATVRTNSHFISMMSMLHTDSEVRDKCRDVQSKLSQFMIDNVTSNRELYQKLKGFIDSVNMNELNDEQRKYIKELQLGFHQQGFDLNDVDFALLQDLKKELVSLSQSFSKNINEDNSVIRVSVDSVDGVSEELTKTWEVDNETEEYLLKMDYPTVFGVLGNCNNATTRETVWVGFDTRAPENGEVLESLREKRDAMAQLLGYPDYATMDLEDETIKNPDNAAKFIEETYQGSLEKMGEELGLLRGRYGLGDEMNPWDYMYYRDLLKKEDYSIDEQKLSEYFPFNVTFDGLMNIYQQFFGISLTEVVMDQEMRDLVWHDEVRVMQLSKNNELLGYVLLDLHPRDGKYTHACCGSMIKSNGANNSFEKINSNLAMSLVIANFPRGETDADSLMKFNDVTTFFHEFGHAIHGIMSRPEMLGFAGTNVNTDFVELPSQLLEEWMYQPEILKMVGKHYQTGEVLDDTMIDNLIKSQKVDLGAFTCRQMWYATLSLGLYSSGNMGILAKDYVKDTYIDMMKGFKWDSRSAKQNSFGHLNGYGSRYYCYHYTDVYAKDCFEYILENKGLLDSNMGERYTEKLLSPGGSKDPVDMLTDFLGRPPNSEAYGRYLME